MGLRTNVKREKLAKQRKKRRLESTSSFDGSSERNKIDKENEEDKNEHEMERKMKLEVKERQRMKRRHEILMLEVGTRRQRNDEEKKNIKKTEREINAE